MDDLPTTLQMISTTDNVDFSMVLRVLQFSDPEAVQRVLIIERFQTFMKYEINHVNQNKLDTNFGDAGIEDVLNALIYLRDCVPDTPQMKAAFTIYTQSIIEQVQKLNSTLQTHMQLVYARQGEITSIEAQLRAKLNVLTGNTLVEKLPQNES